MVIKTITRFIAKPLLWFTLLSLPLIVFGMVALLSGLFTGSVGHMISLPLTGSGLVLLAAAANMMGAGAFGELVYKLGDVRERDFSRLTQQVHRAP
jgi:hypothetical protein